MIHYDDGLVQNDIILIFIKENRDIALTNSETYLKSLLFAVKYARYNLLNRVILTLLLSHASKVNKRPNCSLFISVS